MVLSNMGKGFLFLGLCVALVSETPGGLGGSAMAQETGVIKGKVRDLLIGKPLGGVLVRVSGTTASTVTDVQGLFELRDIPAGTYSLEFIKESYLTLILTKQVVIPSRVTTIIAQMTPGEGEDVFYIGGIKVEAAKAELPADPVSRVIISSGEIENRQASSLGDVLELIPGVEKSDRLGLGRKVQASIRGRVTDVLSTFGTKIIVDEAPISNNANMQIVPIGGKIAVTPGQGIDLRQIPADNIELVEVIKGVPSVRYGDFTEGIIKVRTKFKPRPPRLKLKSNPDTREANLEGGLRIGPTLLNYNFNYGYSERDPRKKGDEYHRLTAELGLRRKFLMGRLSLQTKVLGQRLIDEEKPTDVYKNRRYNRGYRINFDVLGDYEVNPITRWKGNLLVHFRRQNSYKERLVEADPRSYIGWVRVLGNEWLIGGRLEWTQRRFIGGSFHEFLVGVDFEHFDNTGVGMVIDSTRNYYGPLSGKRSYSFDIIPGYPLVGLYAEDQIALRWGLEASVTLGFRVDLFKPKQLDLWGLLKGRPLIRSQHGSYLSPRLGAVLFLDPQTRLRFGMGLSAKAPSLSYIFVPPRVLSFRDYTLRHEQSNFDLKGYQLQKLDIGFDRRFFNFLRCSFEVYWTRRLREPKQISYPFGYETNPDTVTAATYKIYQNWGWTRRRGWELTLKTRTFHYLSLLVNASYRYTKSGQTGLVYDTRPDTAKGETPWYIPGYQERWVLLMDYRLTYQAKPLGIWVTLWFQHEIWRKIQNYRPRSTYWYENLPLEFSPKGVLNLRISKSLFPGAEVSLYLNNVLDDRALFRHPYTGRYAERNGAVFYGFELSAHF